MGKTKLSSKRGDWLCDAVLVMLITAVALFQIDKALGVTWGYAVEISYWGTAAMLTGKDWSDFMSYSSYYSFIYGLLLIPVISLPFDSVLIYRLAIFLNALLLVFTYFVSCRCMMKIFESTDKKIIRIACAATVLYSSNIFYTQNTNGEILYLFLFWVLLYCGLFFLKKKSVFAAVCMTLAALLNFAAHMRSLSLLLATVLLILFISISEKKYRLVLASAATLVTGYLLFNSAKEAVLQIVYQGGEFTKYNDVSGQASKLANLTSLSDFGRILCMCFGRLFYLGTSTVLLLYMGVFICIFFIFSVFLKSGKRKKKRDKREGIKGLISVSYWPILLFLLLSLAFSIGISALYFQDPGEYVSFVFYGRYTEYLIGPFLIIALLALYNETRQCGSFYALSVVTHLLLCLVVYFYLENNDISKNAIHPNAVGVAGILTNLGSSSIEYATFGIGLVAVLTATVIFLVMRSCKTQNRDFRLRGYITVAVLLVFFWTYHTYTYINNTLHSDAMVKRQELYIDIAEEMEEIGEDEAVVFPFDGILNGAGMYDMTFLQFKVPDTKINLVSVLDAEAEKEVAEADYLLWSASVTYPEELEEIRDACFEIVIKNDYLTLYRRCSSG